MDAIARRHQGPDRIIQDLALEGGIEAVGPQHNFMTVLRAKAQSGMIETVAPPHRQVARGGKAQQLFRQPAQHADLVAQVQQRREFRGQRRITRHARDQPVAQGIAVLLRPRRQHLDLHPRHVHAGGAFALAGLAGDAKLHGLQHGVAGEGALAQLARHRQPQGVGPAAGDMLLVAGGAIGGAHRPAFGFAAGAIVVALLGRALEAADHARIGRPVQHGLEIAHFIFGRIAEQAALVEFGRPHDLAGIHHPLRIETVLHLLEGLDQLGPEHLLMEFAAHQPVAMLAGMRALVLAHHLEGFLGDGAHRLDVFLQPQVQHGPHMQAALAGMGVPGALGAVALEAFRQPRGIFRQMRQRHGAVFHEGDRLSLILHGHHDVEAGLAQFGDRGLQLGIIDLDHPAPFGALVAEIQTQIAHHLVQLRHAAGVFLFAAVEFHQQDRLRLAAQHRFKRGMEHGNFRRQPQHGVVHQLDRDRLQGDQILGRVHRRMERAEMADPQRPPAQHRRKLQA